MSHLSLITSLTLLEVRISTETKTYQIKTKNAENNPQERGIFAIKYLTKIIVQLC